MTKLSSQGYIVNSLIWLKSCLSWKVNSSYNCLVKKVAFFSIAVIAILAGLVFFSNQQKASNTALPEEKEREEEVSKGRVDFTASFEIYTNGTKRVFTDSKYHNLSPDVYIERGDPNIVYVKKTGTTWDDFFKTLPMELTKNCLTTGTGQVFCSGEAGGLKFLLNDEETPNALDLEITDDSFLQVRFE